MTHLDDTYEGDGEHDDPVIAVALAGCCPSSERLWSNARVVWSAISALGNPKHPACQKRVAMLTTALLPGIRTRRCSREQPTSANTGRNSTGKRMSSR